MEMETISVVIPIYNQSNLIGWTLEALMANSLQPQEVIIVDDGSSDNVQSIVTAFESRAPFTLRLLSVIHGGPGAARDAGWRAAEGEIVAFTDADAIPDRLWLEWGLKGFSSPKVGGVEGQVEGGDMPPKILTHQVKNPYGGQFMTANMFYRRSVIAKVGGFKSPYREDSDLAFSVLEAGYDIVFSRNARVIHPPREESWRFYFSKANRKRFEALLFRNHPQIAPQYLPRFQPTELLIISSELMVLLSLILGVWFLAGGLFLLAIGLPKRLADWLDGRQYSSREYLIAWLVTLVLVPVEAYHHWMGVLKPPQFHVKT
jgi:hypothetical protein